MKGSPRKKTGPVARRVLGTRRYSSTRPYRKADAIPEHPELFTLGVSMLGGPDVLAGSAVGWELTESRRTQLAA